MINATTRPGLSDFGRTIAGDQVDRVTLSDGNLTVSLLTLGVTLQGLWLADVPHSLTLGCATLAQYQATTSYLGALVGPVANRITGAKALITGRMHHFDASENGNTLHSGPSGLQNRIWQLTRQSDTAATFTLALPDGEGGFPGNRLLKARYSLQPNATLRLEITATTDAPTPINIANHSYWNLDGTPDWSGHSLQINAAHWLPVDRQGLPLGPRRPTSGAMDFRRPRHLQPADPALDHNFCLAETRRPLSLVARLTGAKGVSMTLSTTEPGLQAYDGRNPIRPDDAAYAGLALEPQGWPDALHHPAFPSILLRTEASYHQISEWQFSRI